MIELSLVERDSNKKFIGRRSVVGTGAALAQALTESKRFRVNKFNKDGSQRDAKAIAREVRRKKAKLEAELFHNVK